MTSDPPRGLDATDRAILDALQEDGRLSVAAVGRRVGLSAPAVAERVRRLEGSGVVTGYHAAVDRARVGRPLLAFVRVATTGGVGGAVAEAAAASPAVLEVHRVTDDDCHVLKVAVRDVRALEAEVDRYVRFGRVATSVVLTTVVERVASLDPG